MRVCQKCFSDTVRFLKGQADALDDQELNWSEEYLAQGVITLESECEFWAHKELNRHNQETGRVYISVGGFAKLGGGLNTR